MPRCSLCLVIDAASYNPRGKEATPARNESPGRNHSELLAGQGLKAKAQCLFERRSRAAPTSEWYQHHRTELLLFLHKQSMHQHVIKKIRLMWVAHFTWDLAAPQTPAVGKF